MRLIDADALKKALNFVYDCNYIGSTSIEGIASDIIDVIDDAPTVEQECYITGEQWNQFMKEHRRPQGEWLNIAKLTCQEYDGREYGECSICHKVREVENYCPHCGADMKGGKNEQTD